MSEKTLSKTANTTFTCHLCGKQRMKTKSGLGTHIARFCPNSEIAKNREKGMKTGTPELYLPEYVEKVKEYLKQCEDAYTTEIVAYTQKEFDGPWTNVSKRTRLKVRLPSRVAFADFIDIDEQTIYDWEKRHPEFAQSLRRIDRAQHQKLIEGGLGSEYNPQITKLMLSSNHGYAERKVSDVKGGLTIEELLGEDDDEDDEEDS